MHVFLFALFFVCLTNNGTAQAAVVTTTPLNSSDLYATSSPTSSSSDGRLRMVRFSADDEEEEGPVRERRSPGVRGYARPPSPPSGGRYNTGAGAGSQHGRY